MNFDFDMPHFNDEGGVLADIERFPAMAADDPRRTGGLRLSSQTRGDEELSDFAEAPLRRRPKPRAMRVDQKQELHSTELTAWTQNYLNNMAEATMARKTHQAPWLAKQKASSWFTGLGIGGVGMGTGSSNLTSPLALFAGNAMLELLTGVQIAAGRKRARGDDSGDETDIEVLHTRKRQSDGEIGLGDEMVLPLDDDMGLEASDVCPCPFPEPLLRHTLLTMWFKGIEVGRHGATPLADDPTFPWNTTASALASRPGSSIARGYGPGFASSLGGFPTSAAGHSSIPGLPPGSLGRRASRVTSASPLIGRGTHRYSSLEVPGGDDDDELLGQAQPASDVPAQSFDDDNYDSFQLHGPGAGIGTQTVAQSQWIRATLDREAHNFLNFVEAEINALPPITSKAERSIDDDEDELSSLVPVPTNPVVEFEQLLPPGQHSAVVAAQALHHVLALATKGLVNVEQTRPFAAIQLSIPSGV